MNNNSAIYPKLAQQLARSVISNSNETIRRQTRHQILSYLINCLNVTSAYICRYDASKRQAVVVDEYIKRHANSQEIQSDLSFVYTEEELGDMVHWLEADTHPPRILQLDEMDIDDPERDELIEFGGKTVLYLPIYTPENVLWGWGEIWETRHKRIFDADDFHNAEIIIKCLSRLV